MCILLWDMISSFKISYHSGFFFSFQGCPARRPHPDRQVLRRRLLRLRRRGQLLRRAQVRGLLLQAHLRPQARLQARLRAQARLRPEARLPRQARLRSPARLPPACLPPARLWGLSDLSQSQQPLFCVFGTFCEVPWPDLCSIAPPPNFSRAQKSFKGLSYQRFSNFELFLAESLVLIPPHIVRVWLFISHCWFQTTARAALFIPWTLFGEIQMACVVLSWNELRLLFAC